MLSVASTNYGYLGIEVFLGTDTLEKQLMNKTQIKKYYKFIGYLNLILSLLFLVFSREIELKERLFGAVEINVGYHMFYYFFSGIYKGTERMRSLNSFNKNIGIVMIGIFAIMGMLASLFLVFIFLFDAFVNNEFNRLFAICIPFGILLGAYSLWKDVRNDKTIF